MWLSRNGDTGALPQKLISDSKHNIAVFCYIFAMMKVTAYIVLLSLLTMGATRFMHGMEEPVTQVEMSCEKDCCDSHDDCEKEADTSSEHSCPPGCDCDCCFHITALNYHFISVPGATVQSFHYVSYQISYTFEYFTPLFQPPRLG